MQEDENSDLHPCTYFSCTFSSAQHNYDIYDRELLAVILALEEWCQYLQETAHPITIITDHKNLSYVKDPRKLSRRQARWSLFLQDFDIQWQVTPGTKMAPADALSRRDHVDTTLDNQETSICPEPVVIHALDLALARKIRSSTESDPLALKALVSGSRSRTGLSRCQRGWKRLLYLPRSRTGLLHMSIRISKRSSNSPQSMPKRAETTEVSIGEVQTYIVLCGEGTLVPHWE